MLSRNQVSGMRSAALLVLGLSAGVFPGLSLGQSAKQVVDVQQSADSAARQSQQKINALDDQTQRMLDEYRQTVRETASLRQYNEQLDAQVSSQKEEIASIDEQLQQIETTNREVYPMMQKMLATLEKFVELDVPFLPDERENRITELKDIMTRADVTTAEKYRRLLEAYSVEMEYGRTIEAYRGGLTEAGEEREVDFLRVGRVALMYQTLDGKETGYWDEQASAWQVDNDFSGAVVRGLRIAKKQAAPDLITMPVPAPQEAQ